MRNDPRLKSQVPLVMPNHQKALDLSWEIIEADILVAEAFELIRLEKDLFSADSSVLATARLLGSEVVKDSIDSDSVFSKRLNQFGVEFAKKELNYFNRLNKKFFKLISENSETRYDILYRLRRSVFGRGQDFGGRMNSLLSSCRDLTFTMGK